MRTHNLAAIALAAAGLIWANAAEANIVIVSPAPSTYTVVDNVAGGGAYGMELRGGKAGAQDWETGVGYNTQGGGTEFIKRLIPLSPGPQHEVTGGPEWLRT